jgi:hypothetical protein
MAYDKDDIKRQLIEMANHNEALMDGTMAPVMEIIGSHDLVFAVWDDKAEPGGVSVLIVKGNNKLREVIATGVMQNQRLTAIRCVDLEHAVALTHHVAANDPDSKEGGHRLH